MSTIINHISINLMYISCVYLLHAILKLLKHINSIYGISILFQILLSLSFYMVYKSYPINRCNINKQILKYYKYTITKGTSPRTGILFWLSCPYLKTKGTNPRTGIFYIG
eukprot:508615_1